MKSANAKKQNGEMTPQEFLREMLGPSTEGVAIENGTFCVRASNDKPEQSKQITNGTFCKVVSDDASKKGLVESPIVNGTFCKL